MNQKHINRRRFLGATALGAGSLFLGSLLPKRAFAQAAADKGRKFIFAYFEGGWDLLLGLDPRDPASTNAEQHKIDPRYGSLSALYRERGVQTRGALRFGPAVPPELLAHASKLSIINAIGMDTAAHEVGRRYFITGQFPRGIAAVGSSVPSEIIAQVGDQNPIPNMAAGVESYTRGLPAYASALTVNSLTDLVVALTPFIQIDPAILAAVEAYQDQGAGCAGRKLDRDGLSSSLQRNQQRARQYVESELSSIFDTQRTDAQMRALRELYGMSGAGASPNSPEVLAFVAGQAIKNGISQCVSFQATNGLDSHSNWAQDQAPAQERGWRTLAALITDLEGTESTTQPGRSLLEETTIVAFSEFGRTPMFNNLDGRDHFLGNSALIAGAGIVPGRTIGKSAEIGMMPLETDLDTGEAVPDAGEAQRGSGRVVTLSPKHVLSTVLESAGLDSSHLRSEPIRALIG